MFFRNAKKSELYLIYDLYKSVVGTQFCVWNDLYPSMLEINEDYNTNNLYVLVDDETIVGAISIVPKNEMDVLNSWEINDGTQKEIARVVVKKECQGKGYAKIMVTSIIEILKKNNCHSIHLSVVDTNIPAIKTYEKAGFNVVGKEFIYGSNFYLFEKLL